MCRSPSRSGGAGRRRCAGRSAHSTRERACQIRDPGRAVPLYEQTVTDRGRVLSEDHPDTPTSRIQLAYTYRAVGDLHRAILLYKQILPTANGRGAKSIRSRSRSAIISPRSSHTATTASDRRDRRFGSVYLRPGLSRTFRVSRPQVSRLCGRQVVRRRARCRVGSAGTPRHRRPGP
ncbi:tetratricopeptide repeat protein [Streptomyces sp. NBC_00638]|uniref:tetratricopeptide repeat protein n=1 Tax=Streptomyces sp. NBC_00638 TaxID=2975794 RepID=UPI00338F7D6A